MKRIIFKLLFTALIFAIGTSCPDMASAKGLKEPKGKIKEFGVIPKRIGGKWLKSNPKECLEYMAKMGYTQMDNPIPAEWGMTREELKPFLKSLGIKPVITSVSPQAIINEKDRTELMQAIENAKFWGVKYLVCYSSTGGARNTIEAWRDWAYILNKAGKICKENGLMLLYHNHAKEFELINGKSPSEVMLEVMDPKLVNYYLDVAWAIRGGADPAKFINDNPGRVLSLHLKDLKPNGKTFEDLGLGTIDYKAVFSAAHKAKVKYYIVEMDTPPVDSKTSIEKCAEYLKTKKYKK